MGNAANSFNQAVAAPISLLGSNVRGTLFEGKGTPWGAMETGRPDAPNFQSYMSDPNAFKGVDLSPLKAQRQKEAGLLGNQASRSYQAQAAKMFGPSGTATADVTRRLGDISTQTQYNQQKIAADVAQAEWNSKMQEMDAFNQARQRANQLLADKYNADAAAFNAEQQARGNFVSSGLGTLGSIAGAVIGGLPSAGAGSAAGAAVGGAAGNALGRGIGDMFGSTGAMAQYTKAPGWEGSSQLGVGSNPLSLSNQFDYMAGLSPEVRMAYGNDMLNGMYAIPPSLGEDPMATYQRSLWRGK